MWALYIIVEGCGVYAGEVWYRQPCMVHWNSSQDKSQNNTTHKYCRISFMVIMAKFDDDLYHIFMVDRSNEVYYYVTLAEVALAHLRQ